MPDEPQGRHPEEDRVEGDDEPDRATRRRRSEMPPVPVLPMIRSSFDEQDHEHEDDRQQEALEVLGAKMTGQQVDARDEHDQGARSRGRTV